MLIDEVNWYIVINVLVIVGAEGDEHYDYDMLASIELLIIDECDVLLMQNWAHLLHIMAHLHKTPKQDRGADYRLHIDQICWQSFYIFSKYCVNSSAQTSYLLHYAAKAMQLKDMTVHNIQLLQHW